MRLGVLDIGSTTVHLLVVDGHKGGAPLPAVSHNSALRLTQRIDGDGAIELGAVDALLDVVLESLTLAEDMGVTQVMAFATSAIRGATNSEDVLARVAERTGVEVELLTGEQEARLTFLAARRWFGWSAGRLLVIDIGGGSLELAVGADEEPEAAFSLELGAGRLTRRFIVNDPPQAEAVRSMRRHIRAELGEVVGGLRRGSGAGKAVATSKTWRQLARIAGAAPSSEGPFVHRQLQREDLRLWVAKLGGMSSEERSRLPGVSETRSSQLLAGAVVAEAAMDLLDLNTVDLCPWALREGYILSHLDALGD